MIAMLMLLGGILTTDPPARDVIVTITGECRVIEADGSLPPCTPQNCRLPELRAALKRWDGYPDPARDRRAMRACGHSRRATP